MFIDTHAHLQWEEYKNDFEQVLKNAKTAHVEYILTVGTTIETSKQSVDLSDQYDFIYSSVGVHPHDVKNLPENYMDTLKNLAEHSKVIAIGEVGLDFFYEHSPRDRQLKVFEEQLHLAKDLDLPVSIHCREAFKECFDIIQKASPLKRKGVFHCFTGTKEEAREVLEMDFFISISGIITFKKATALHEVVKVIPLEKMLIETDCPYLAPEPYRGKRNEPSYIVETAKKISELKNMSVQDIEKITTENAKRLFHFLEKGNTYDDRP